MTTKRTVGKQKLILTITISLLRGAEPKQSHIPAISTCHTAVESCPRKGSRLGRAGGFPHIEPSPPGTLCTRFSDQASAEHRHTCPENVQSVL